MFHLPVYHPSRLGTHAAAEAGRLAPSQTYFWRNEMALLTILCRVDADLAQNPTRSAPATDQSKLGLLLNLWLRDAFTRLDHTCRSDGRLSDKAQAARVNGWETRRDAPCPLGHGSSLIRIAVISAHCSSGQSQRKAFDKALDEGELLVSAETD